MSNMCLHLRVSMVVENVSESRVKVVFDVTAQEFDVALDEAFKIVNEKTSIKGFRKGKAPRAVFEKNYGVESLYDEALNIVLNSKAKEVYENEELAKKMCGQFEPALEGKEFGQGKDFQLSLSFDIYPEFELPMYKGLEVAKANYEATDEEVNASLNAILKQAATIQVKEDQVINSGDIAVFDFAGSTDGVPFDGGTAENYELEVGSGQFIPGFEEQMIGMKNGETKDINVTFPEAYHAENLAGKPAVFKVTLHEVKEEVLPELTDEYVVSLNLEGIKTVEELKNSKIEEIKAGKVTSEKDRQVDFLINKILDNTVVSLPQSIIDENVNRFKSQYEQQAQMYNIPFETFLGFMNTTKEAFENTANEQGKRQALFSIVMNKLIEVENLAPTKEEMEERAQKDAEASKLSVEQLISQNLNSYYSELSYNKVMDFIVSNAKEV